MDEEAAAQPKVPDTAAQPATDAVPDTDPEKAVDHKPPPQAGPGEEDPVDWNDDEEEDPPVYMNF